MIGKTLAVLLLCIALAAAAGCTGFGKSADQAYPQQAAYTSGSSERIADTKMVYYGESAPAPLPAATPSNSVSGTPGSETRIIKTARITVEVKDIPGSIESLKSLAAAKGGYISSTSMQTNYNKQLTGSVVLRIPQAEFENVLAGVKAIGTVKSASTQGEDVTEEYIDLQAQKTSYQNQLAQYNAIMKQSTKVEDIIKVQEQIDRVQTELDRLEGRIKYLNSRVDMSTISVSLEEPEPVGGDSGHNFISAINEGISGFFGMIDALIILFFMLLPLIILGGIGYYAHRWYKGRKAPVTPADTPEKK